MVSRTAAVLALVASVSALARADEADPVVARVGTQVLRASDVARRLAAMPPFQLASFGTTPADVRKRVVASLLVPELLYAAEADQRAVAAQPDVSARIRDARKRALVDAMRTELSANGVPEDDVRSYFTSHRDEFEKPQRIRISRILTGDDATARKVLADVRGVRGPERWNKWAREVSLDQATKLRGGALGFVFPDGRTEVPQVKVDSALYDAASKVKDGELVPDPVNEGGRFAVVWRRGTLPAENRTLDEERKRIREILLRKRLDDELQALLDSLRKRYVVSTDPSLLESPLPGESSTPPPSAPREPSSADPVPEATDRGLR